MLSILFMIAVNIVLIAVVAKFVLSKGEVHIQNVYDYNYDEVEHANYWNEEHVSNR